MGLAVRFLRLGQNEVGDLEFGAFKRNSAFNPELIEAFGADVAGSYFNAQLFQYLVHLSPSRSELNYNFT